MKELTHFNNYLNSIIEADSSWKSLYAANKNTIADPNKIYPGQTLQLPSGGTYTVQKGDTLSKIASSSGQGAMRSVPKTDNVVTQPDPNKLPKTQQAAQSQLQTADDFVRSMANAATFGYADKLAAAMSSKFGGGKDYDTELKKEYGKSAAAGQRSPTASTAGEIAGTVASPAFAGGAALGTKALARVAPQAGKLAQFGAGAAGGFAADTAAEKAAKKLDPNNPWIDESKTMKINEFTDTNLGEAPIKAVSSALRANRGRSLAGALGGAGSRAEKLAAQSAELSPADKLNREVGAKVWRVGEPASTVDRLNKAAGAKVWRQGEPAAAAALDTEKAAAGAVKGGKPLGRGTTAALSALGGGLIGYGLGSGDKGQAPKPADDSTGKIDITTKPELRPNRPARSRKDDMPQPTPGVGPQAMAPTISDRAAAGDPHVVGVTKSDDPIGDEIKKAQDEKLASTKVEPTDIKSRNPQIAGVFENELNSILKLAGRNK